MGYINKLFKGKNMILPFINDLEEFYKNSGIVDLTNSDLLAMYHKEMKNYIERDIDIFLISKLKTKVFRRYNMKYSDDGDSFISKLNDIKKKYKKKTTCFPDFMIIHPEPVYNNQMLSSSMTKTVEKETINGIKIIVSTLVEKDEVLIGNTKLIGEVNVSPLFTTHVKQTQRSGESLVAKQVMEYKIKEDTIIMVKFEEVKK